MGKRTKDPLTFEEITIKTGKRKKVWYIAQGWAVPLQAGRETWIKRYGVDPKKAVVKKSVIEEKT